MQGEENRKRISCVHLWQLAAVVSMDQSIAMLAASSGKMPRDDKPSGKAKGGTLSGALHPANQWIVMSDFKRKKLIVVGSVVLSTVSDPAKRRQ